MGSPQNPTKEQIDTLQKAGQLATMGPAEKLKVTDGQIIINMGLPRQGVSLIQLSW
jgi:xylan 1,4-beta-xylosidase